jgi:hypothetical protein
MPLSGQIGDSNCTLGPAGSPRSLRPGSSARSWRCPSAGQPAMTFSSWMPAFSPRRKRCASAANTCRAAASRAAFRYCHQASRAGSANGEPGDRAPVGEGIRGERQARSLLRSSRRFPPAIKRLGPAYVVSRAPQCPAGSLISGALYCRGLREEAVQPQRACARGITARTAEGWYRKVRARVRPSPAGCLTAGGPVQRQ